MPSEAAPAATTNANLYPATSAAASGSRSPESVSAWAAASVTSTANPTAVPTWAEVFMNPEARPRCPSPTADIPRAVDVADAQPRPNPERTAPRIAYLTPPSTVIPAVTRADAATAASPRDIVALPPIRRERRPLRTELAITQMLNGKPIRPASDAEYPSVFCR